MIIETEEDLLKLQRIGRICANVLRDMRAAARPGITTGELDELGGRPDTLSSESFCQGKVSRISHFTQAK